MASASALCASSWPAPVVDDYDFRDAALAGDFLQHFDFGRLERKLERAEVRAHVLGARRAGERQHADRRREAKNQLSRAATAALAQPPQRGVLELAAIGGEQRKA